ncbi:5261_t:CDS:2, partial [Gigaspora rosea]
VREEGISGLYKGLTASYLGVTESTIHWVAYEYLKSKLSERRKIISGESVQPFHLRMFDNLLAAGLSKFVAACISYPHEVDKGIIRILYPPATKWSQAFDETLASVFDLKLEPH